MTDDKLNEAIKIIEQLNIECDKIAGITYDVTNFEINKDKMIANMIIELVSNKKEIYNLNSKIDKLKQLILLTDESVSNVELNELSAKQWNEFIKTFPDEI